MKVWECKIGDLKDFELPNGADFPLRMAVKNAYYNLTGIDAQFCFSGWGSKLDELELSVVEKQHKKAE